MLEVNTRSYISASMNMRRQWNRQSIGLQRRYCEDLAMPKDDPSFDTEHERYLRTNYLLQVLTAENNTLPLVTKNQIIKLINSLKSRKAPDIYGISSEHLKNASPIIYDILLHLIIFLNGTMGKLQKVPTYMHYLTLTPTLPKHTHIRSFTHPHTYIYIP